MKHERHRTTASPNFPVGGFVVDVLVQRFALLSMRRVRYLISPDRAQLSRNEQLDSCALSRVCLMVERRRALYLTVHFLPLLNTQLIFRIIRR